MEFSLEKWRKLATTRLLWPICVKIIVGGVQRAINFSLPRVEKKIRNVNIERSVHTGVTLRCKLVCTRAQGKKEASPFARLVCSRCMGCMVQPIIWMQCRWCVWLMYPGRKPLYCGLQTGVRGVENRKRRRIYLIFPSSFHIVLLYYRLWSLTPCCRLACCHYRTQTLTQTECWHCDRKIATDPCGKNFSPDHTFVAGSGLVRTAFSS